MVPILMDEIMELMLFFLLLHFVLFVLIFAANGQMDGLKRS
jgi:hypothetical protein